MAAVEAAAEPSFCYCPFPVVPGTMLVSCQSPTSRLTEKQKHRTLTTCTWNHSPEPVSLMSQVIHSPPGFAWTPGQDLSLMGLCECQGTRAVNPPERHQSEGPRTLIGGAHVHK